MTGGSAFASMARSAQSPAAESAITITAVRAARADMKCMARLFGSDSEVNLGLEARCFREISLLLQRMTKRASRGRLKCSVTNSFWPHRGQTLNCGRNLFGSERFF